MKRKLVITIIILAGIGLCGTALAYFFFPGALFQAGLRLERFRSGLATKSVNVGDHRIVYLEGGSGEAVIMLHGFAANKDNWTRFAGYVTPRYHVIAPDLPGFGESTYLASASYGYSAQVERVDELAEALGIEKFHLVGNSMGGGLAGRYAVAHPEKVLSLGLFDAAGVRPPRFSDLSRRIDRGGSNPLLIQEPGDYDQLLDYAFVDPPYIPAFAQKVLANDVKKHYESNEKILKEIIENHDSLEKGLGKIKCPTLILWGDKDRILDVSGADVFQKGIPGSKKVIMKDCGHLPMIERPEESAGIYVDFLKGK